MTAKFLKASVAVALVATLLTIAPAVGSVNDAPQDYVPITACAVADTRSAVAPYPNGKLTSVGSPYTFQVTGDIPAGQRAPGETCASAPGDALGVVVNIVAIQPDGVGNLQATPAGTPPAGGVVTYQALTPPLNNANAVPVEVRLGGTPQAPIGEIDIGVNGADVHVRLVVLGYFVKAPTSTASYGVPAVNNVHPVIVVNCIIAVEGIFPSPAFTIPGGTEDPGGGGAATDPFIGQIIFFAGNFAPRGWAFCDGQLLSPAQNSALFAILGTTYGGDGNSTFALPDMRGRSPMHEGNGPGLTARQLGERLGTETNSQVPAHSHVIPVVAPPPNGGG